MMNKANYEIYTGDALAILKTLVSDSIDSIVTDPPYGISFNGHAWDHGVPDTALWSEALRVLKPGGHIVAFSSARTYHRLAANIEHAGFEIRDQLMWLYASGFPRSHNIALAIERKYGADKAKNWQGWGTTLKPAHEPIVLARKPFQGAVADNVLQFGTGGLNVEACRVGDELMVSKHTEQADNVISLKKTRGRFPANVMHNELQTPWASYFYCPKPSTKERDRGLERFSKKSAHERTGFKTGQTKFKGAGGAARNYHPTVKPMKLMEHLIALVTPRGGTVLDPFVGSGTTLVAAKKLGFAAIGIDKNPDYIKIAKCRVAI